ncbi:MAG: hypothetical protein DI535_14190 [Citrobacter freundii]|nr:MAG: hypothetical protein DI535_14190 [Citrobacter freundii]
MTDNYTPDEQDDRIFSSTAVWDACYEIAQEAMAAALSGSKTIQGKTLEKFISDYVDDLGGN